MTPAPSSRRFSYRRDADGSAWLSFALLPLTDLEAQQPGADMRASGVRPEILTFWPFTEHGCTYHVEGGEVDSSGRRHPPPAPMRAAVAKAEEL